MSDDYGDFQVVAKFLPELNRAAALLSSIDEELGKKFIDDVMKEKAFKSFDQIKNALIAEIAISKFSDDNDLKNLGISLLLSGQKDKAHELETLIRIFSATISSREIIDRFLKHYENIHDDVKRPSVEEIIDVNNQQAIVDNYGHEYYRSPNHSSHSDDIKKTSIKDANGMLAIFLPKNNSGIKHIEKKINLLNYKNRIQVMLSNPPNAKIFPFASSEKTWVADNRLVFSGGIALSVIMIWFASITFGNLFASIKPSIVFGSSNAAGSQGNPNELPYQLIVSCGRGTGDNINPLACFQDSGLSTQLEITNGDQYGMYKVHNLQSLGRFTSDGLTLDLHKTFAVVAQNASSLLTLTITVIDKRTGNIVFQKSASKYGSVIVKN